MRACMCVVLQVFYVHEIEVALQIYVWWLASGFGSLQGELH